MATAGYAVEKRHVTLKPRWQALRDYRVTWFILKACFFMTVLLLLVYPPLSAVPVAFFAVRTFMDFLAYYDNPERIAIYKEMFAPVLDRKHLVRIGYEVYGNELHEHLNIIQDPAQLEAKRRLMERDLHRQVGVSKAVLTTHIWGIGRTGSGKTSFAVTLIRKAMESSCGVIYVDGKGEISNAHWLYDLAVKLGREHEFYVVNYRDPSKSNKFNPIEGLPPEALAEFFFSLMPEASGDQAYWQGRGKALFRPVSHFYYFRWRFWGETFTVETISSALDRVNFSFLSTCTFALIRAYNDKLQADPRVIPLVKEAERYKTPGTSYKAVELLSSYFMQMPQAAYRFESYGYNKDFLVMLYKVYNYIDGYTSSIAPTWRRAHERVGELMVKMAASRGENVLRMSIVSLRKLYGEVKQRLEELSRSRVGGLGGGTATDSELGIGAREASELLASVELSQGRGSGAGDPVQHQYAQQQWDDIMSTINTYAEIFKPLVSDFTISDIIRNGKILFFVFPAMDKSESTMKMLARLLIRTITDTIAQSLGKDFELTRTQEEIVKSLVKPKPLAMVILDEYGSYSVSGVETLAAQIRSLNFSLIILTQDVTSARPAEGQNIPLHRLWGNTSKIIFGVNDVEAIEMVAKTLEEVTVSRESGGVDTGGTTEYEPTRQFVKESEFDPKMLVKFRNGFSLVIGPNRPFLMQTYYSPQDEGMKGWEVQYSLTRLKAV